MRGRAEGTAAYNLITGESFLAILVILVFLDILEILGFLDKLIYLI